MQNLHEDKLASIEIDLEIYKKNALSESFLRMFGSTLQLVLQRMLGGDIFVPVNVKGDPQEVESFAKALNREKRYMQSYAKHGLGDPKTYELKYKLDQAIRDFERSTNLKWPFK